MAVVTKGYSFGATETVTSAKLATLVDSASVGSIVAADISSNAVTDVKINDVSGAKFTTLTAIPGAAGVIPLANIPSIPGSQLITLAGISSGSGVIPIANLATGTPTGLKFLRDDGTLQVPLETGFGGWTTGYSTNTAYQAATNLIVVAYGAFNSGTKGAASMDGITDSAGSPTTRRVYDENTTSGYYGSIIFPVKKNDYWKVEVINMASMVIQTMSLGT